MYYYQETATGNSQWEYPSTVPPQPQPQHPPPSSVALPTVSIAAVSMATLPALSAFPTSHVLAMQTQQMMMSAVAPGYPGLMMSAPMVAPPLPTILPVVVSQPAAVQTYQAAATTTTETKKRAGITLHLSLTFHLKGNTTNFFQALNS